MEHQRISANKGKAFTIFLWLVTLAFFAYSFLTIMDGEALTNRRRHEQLIRVLTAFLQPELSETENIQHAASGMWETIQIGFLATAIGALLAIPFTILSARPGSMWSRGFSMALQPILSAARAIHPLYVTITMIVFAGIGPTAGVLALSIYSTAVLIVAFSEYAQEHASLTWARLLQVYFPGLALKHLPVNVLIGSILGVHGGGGIGLLIMQEIILLDYREASVGLLACLISVGSLDLLARAVWRKIQARDERFSHQAASPPTSQIPAPDSSIE